MEIENSYEEKIADVEEDYKAYRLTYQKSLKSLRKSYVSALNEVGA
jgi:hypothetical protein